MTSQMYGPRPILEVAEAEASVRFSKGVAEMGVAVHESDRQALVTFEHPVESRLDLQAVPQRRTENVGAPAGYVIVELGGLHQESHQRCDGRDIGDPVESLQTASSPVSRLHRRELPHAVGELGETERRLTVAEFGPSHREILQQHDCLTSFAYSGEVRTWLSNEMVEPTGQVGEVQRLAGEGSRRRVIVIGEVALHEYRPGQVVGVLTQPNRRRILLAEP